MRQLCLRRRPDLTFRCPQPPHLDRSAARRQRPARCDGFGSVGSEPLQLNEATLWSGAPCDWNSPDALHVLPEVRAAIFSGDCVKAT